MRRVWFVLCAVLLCAWGWCGEVELAAQGTSEDWQGFGTLEALACKTFAPDVDATVGAGVGIQLTTVPAGWLVIGGRKLFADVVALTTGSISYGGSISLQPSKVDDGFRWGFCWNDEDGTQIWLGKSYVFRW